MKGQIPRAMSQQWLANVWLADGSLESVQEINSQCLALLANMTEAKPSASGGGEKRLPVWSEVPITVREQLAFSPYLLVDAGFADEARWCALHELSVQDLSPTQLQPAFFGPGADVFVRRVLVFAWHMSKANPQLARILLGMTSGCAARLSALRLRELDWLADSRPGWVRLRWESQPAVWRHLVAAASHNDPSRLTQASLRGLQMLAGNAFRSQGS
jgi:hypothetical protein